MNSEKIDFLFTGTEYRKLSGNKLQLTRYTLRRLEEADVKNSIFWILNKDDEAGKRIEIIPDEVLQDKMTDKDTSLKYKKYLFDFVVNGRKEEIVDDKLKIPKRMLRKAGIERDIAFVGEGPLLNVFDAESWRKEMAGIRPQELFDKIEQLAE